ncbi:MAG: hypothetical protein ACLSAH_17615 [Bilophila wadsworthia]
MKTTILSEYGFHEALLGMGLSHGKTSGIISLWDIRDDASLKERALKLAGLGSGHDKFLRMIVVTLDITAPLYWWKQFDTYKVGTVAQSESTMHTLMKKPLTPENSRRCLLICESSMWLANRALKPEPLPSQSFPADRQANRGSPTSLSRAGKLPNGNLHRIVPACS